MWVVDLEQAASRLAKSLQAKLFSRLALLAWFFRLEKAWLTKPSLAWLASKKSLKLALFLNEIKLVAWLAIFSRQGFFKAWLELTNLGF